MVDPVAGITTTGGPYPNSAALQPLAFVFDTEGFWSLWSDREGRLEFEVAADPTGNKGTGWIVDDIRVWNSGSLPALPSLAPPGMRKEAEPPVKHDAKTETDKQKARDEE
jgi:hypothetical protein